MLQGVSMKFLLPIAGLVAIMAPCLPAATMERLAVDEMIQKSTAIVRGRVSSKTAARHGSLIYTVSRVQVLERIKGLGAASVEVAIPGGSLHGLSQTFSGAPHLKVGSEYVLFLWTGRNGLTQVMGFSQGVFDVRAGPDGEPVLFRGATTETMLDPRSGQGVADSDLTMGLGSLRARIRRLLPGEAAQ